MTQTPNRKKSKNMNFWLDAALAGHFTDRAKQAGLTNQAYFEHLFWHDPGPHVRDMAAQVMATLPRDIDELNAELGDLFMPVMRLLEDHPGADFVGNEVVSVPAVACVQDVPEPTGERRKVNLWATPEIAATLKERADGAGMTRTEYFAYLVKNG